MENALATRPDSDRSVVARWALMGGLFAGNLAGVIAGLNMAMMAADLVMGFTLATLIPALIGAFAALVHYSNSLGSLEEMEEDLEKLISMRERGLIDHAEHARLRAAIVKPPERTPYNWRIPLWCGVAGFSVVSAVSSQLFGLLIGVGAAFAIALTVGAVVAVRHLIAEEGEAPMVNAPQWEQLGSRE